MQHLGPPAPPRDACYDCGKSYPFALDLFLPADQWKLIFPEFSGRGLLCPDCIAVRAARFPTAICLRARIEGLESSVGEEFLDPPQTPIPPKPVLAEAPDSEL